jgi:CheY-like chemotaxis protein
MDGLKLLEAIQQRCGAEMPSVIIYTARALSRDETQQLEAYTQAIVLKQGSSSDRLLDEVRLFIRRLKSDQGRREQDPLPIPPSVDLTGRTLLLADDDMRTVYALSATLRAKGAAVLIADTGKAAIEMLEKNAQVEAVLMDIMMPEMDGYEAMRRIRKDARFQALPIIALTAKAMKGDAEKCIEAGATAYLPKPIDGARLLAMIHSLTAGKPA